MYNPERATDFFFSQHQIKTIPTIYRPNRPTYFVFLALLLPTLPTLSALSTLASLLLRGVFGARLLTPAVLVSLGVFGGWPRVRFSGTGISHLNLEVDLCCGVFGGRAIGCLEGVQRLGLVKWAPVPEGERMTIRGAEVGGDATGEQTEAV